MERKTNTSFIALAALFCLSQAQAYETFDTSTSSLTLNDLRINGQSNRVTLTYSGETNALGQPVLALTAFAPNNTCTRGKFSSLSGNLYHINTLTQNGVETGGIVGVSGASYFSAAWSSAPIDQNPFLSGHSTAGLSAGRYGIVGNVSSVYSGFATGDLIKVVGDATGGFGVINLSTNASASFAPSSSATPLPCTSSSADAYSISGNRYHFSLSGLDGSITALGGSSSFSASWSNSVGGIGKVSSNFSGFSVGNEAGVVDIGENAIAVYSRDPSTKKTKSVAVFSQQD